MRFAVSAGPPIGVSQHPNLAARPVAASAWREEAPDAHWLGLRDDGVAVARASLWWRQVPALPDETVGLVGHFAAADEASAVAMLTHAAATLAGHGCTIAIGPMDGSTWHQYRVVTERGAVPPFFLEPDTPDDWPAHFAAAGFDVLASYTSAMVDPVPPASAAIDERARQLAAAGYVVRPLDATRAAAELDALYDVSMTAFADNFLYTPVSRGAFHAQYGALLPRVDPRLVLLAEQAGRAAGYVFAVPDLLELARTGRATTAVVKTLAVDPRHGGIGLGGVLVEAVQRAAVRLGLTRIVHALMIESNRSQRISRRYGRTFRRYALLSRRLP